MSILARAAGTLFVAALTAASALAQAPEPVPTGPIAPSTHAVPPLPPIPPGAVPPIALPPDAMSNPAVLPGLLGVPYTLTDGGRCSMTVVNGINVKLCIAPPPGGSPTGPTTTPPGKPDVALQPVTVQSGDTLGEIARGALQLAISMGLIAPPGPNLWGPGGLVDLLARHNSIENPDLIFPGQVIDVSIDELGATASAPPAPGLPAIPGIPVIPGIPAPPMPPAHGDPSSNTSFPPFALGPDGLPLPPPGNGMPPPPALPIASR